MPNVFDKQGRPVNLGSELGRGGEGSVYEVAGKTDIVAKIYHKPLISDKEAKIIAMSSLPSERLQKIATWPIGTIHQKPNAAVCGLLMPKISGFKEVHTLYGPKSRLTHFPNATWPFLVHTAMNAARAFAVIHEQGHVIGDVNQSNLCVSDKATVKLIDCDSFQIVQNGRSYLCEVGVPTHTPPELQGRPFHGVTRTPNHDNFGLAIVIFQLLFMGRHPFSGQYLGPGDMSIEKAISEFRFAYGPQAKSRQMKPPPATLPLEAVSNQIAILFERAFRSDGTKLGERPRAQDWVAALNEISQNIKPCRRNTGHQYLAVLPQCPWCEIENKSGIVLFNVIVVGATNSVGKFDAELIWTQIRAVPHPGQLPPLTVPAMKISPSPKVQEAIQQRILRRWIYCGVTILLGMFLAATLGSVVPITVSFILFFVAVSIANSPVNKIKQPVQLAFKSAEVQLRAAEQRWNHEAGSQDFERRLKELEAVKKQLHDLQPQRQLRLRQLDQERSKRQLEKYMDRFKLQSASIDGIGQGRIATLQSYGIETAGDITEYTIMSIPGFGPSLTSKLISWRQMHEQKFVFNPNVGVDPADTAAIEQEFMNLRMKLEQELQKGPAELQQLSQKIRYQREVLKPGLDQAIRIFTQARADYDDIK